MGGGMQIDHTASAGKYGPWPAAGDLAASGEASSMMRRGQCLRGIVCMLIFTVYSADSLTLTSDHPRSSRS